MMNTLFELTDITFWIIIWVCELAILTFILLKNYVKTTPLPILTIIGLSMVIFGTYFFLVFTVALFSLDEFSMICMLDKIDAKLFGTGDLMKCYTNGSDLKWLYFNISIVMSMVIVFGNILQVNRMKNEKIKNTMNDSNNLTRPLNVKILRFSNGQKRLFILIGVGIISSILVSILPHYFITMYEITEIASIATIVAASLTLLGAVFTAVYKEIFSYYKDKSESAQKKWELVLPMIEKNYMPWISAANSLSNSFKSVQTEKIEDSQINRILFLFTVFYGIRLRNLQKNGGYILLSTIKEEEEISEAYEQVKKALNWADNETPNRINELQEIFVKYEKEDNPYSIIRFEDDLNKCSTIQESKTIFQKWLTPERAKIAQFRLEEFVKTFKNSINRLSSSWDN